MLGLLKRQGLLKGVFGGSQFWFVVWLAVVVRDRLKKRKEPEPVFCAELKPGHAFTISHLTEDREGRVPRKLRKQAHSTG